MPGARARSPVPPRAASCLRSSRHPDPQECHRGVRRASSPLWLQPPPPPAGWPLSHRFHRSRLRFPAPLPSLINIGDGSAGSRHSSEAGPVPCLHLCTLFPPELRRSPSGLRGLVTLIHLCWVGWELCFLVGCRWPPPCSPRLCGESPPGWLGVSLPYNLGLPSALSMCCCPNPHCLLGKLQVSTDLLFLPGPVSGSAWVLSAAHTISEMWT